MCAMMSLNLLRKVEITAYTMCSLPALLWYSQECSVTPADLRIYKQLMHTLLKAVYYFYVIKNYISSLCLINFTLTFLIRTVISILLYWWRLKLQLTFYLSTRALEKYDSLFRHEETVSS